MRWRRVASEKRQREDLGEQDWCPLEKKAALYHHKRDRDHLPSLPVTTHEVIKTEKIKGPRRRGQFSVGGENMPLTLRSSLSLGI